MTGAYFAVETMTARSLPAVFAAPYLGWRAGWHAFSLGDTLRAFALCAPAAAVDPPGKDRPRPEPGSGNVALTDRKGRIVIGSVIRTVGHRWQPALAIPRSAARAAAGRAGERVSGAHADRLAGLGSADLPDRDRPGGDHGDRTGHLRPTDTFSYCMRFIGSSTGCPADFLGTSNGVSGIVDSANSNVATVTIHVTAAAKPTVKILAPTVPFTLTKTATLSWAGADYGGGPGLGFYQVRTERARWNGSFGPWSQGPPLPPGTTAIHPVLAVGYDYCFEVQATDLGGA
ncbi:MAG TPA: hypothetical protein VNF47_24000 [Streptosporangiaceae bacterium]|nr:hypothetical protein [Streptosporangiaceae bacterium]